jgi:death-on-curing protein
MPRQQFGGGFLHKNSAAMAAAYLFHIAQNHPFVDGNKRAAVMSALAFLLANGVKFSLASQELEAMTLNVAAGELSKETLTKWMHTQIGKRK